MEAGKRTCLLHRRTRFQQLRPQVEVGAHVGFVDHRGGVGICPVSDTNSGQALCRTWELLRGLQRSGCRQFIPISRYRRRFVLPAVNGTLAYSAEDVSSSRD